MGVGVGGVLLLLLLLLLLLGRSGLAGCGGRRMVSCRSAVARYRSSGRRGWLVGADDAQQLGLVDTLGDWAGEKASVSPRLGGSARPTTTIELSGVSLSKE